LRSLFNPSDRHTQPSNLKQSATIRNKLGNDPPKGFNLLANLKETIFSKFFILLAPKSLYLKFNDFGPENHTKCGREINSQ
jgi:hypothetical protein